MKLQDIVNLITIRNHLNGVLNGVGGGVNKGNQKLVSQKISELDNVIIDKSVSLDISSLNEPTIISIGNQDFKPTEKDLDNWRTTWEQNQTASPDFTIKTEIIEQKPVKKAKGFKRSGNDENS